MGPIATTPLRSGGVLVDSVRVRCRIEASKKTDEVIVTLEGVPGVVTDPAFFVDPILVEPQPRAGAGPVLGTVQALLLSIDGDNLLIEVPGEPASYGPKLLVPRSLVE